MPLDLKVVSFDSTTISIQWEGVECSNRNGEIESYNVTYYCTSEKSEAISTIVSSQTFTATRLKFSTNYVFEVQALSRKAESGLPAVINVNTSDRQGKKI